MVTLGATVVFRGIVLYFTRGAPVSIENESFLDVYSARTVGSPNSVLIAVVLIGVAAFMLNLTVFGREVGAIGGGERIAHLPPSSSATPGGAVQARRSASSTAGPAANSVDPLDGLRYTHVNTTRVK